MGRVGKKHQFHQKKKKKKNSLITSCSIAQTAKAKIRIAPAESPVKIMRGDVTVPKEWAFAKAHP